MTKQKEIQLSSSKVKLAIVILFVFLLVLASKFLNIPELLKNSLQWISSLGIWGPVIFVLLYIFACIFFIPGSILTLGAGIVFGVLKGSVIVSVSSTLGAAAAFLVGRFLARDWVSRKIEGNQKFQAIDKAVAKEGWKIVGLVRLSPIFPFNLLNYAFGLTRVSFQDYFLASWIGMMPGTVMYVYIGSLAGSLANLGGARERTAGEWALYVIGLMATVVVTLHVTKLARKALDEKIIRG